eukprot:Clim_evm42s246 gene=Clim_evmTU42s246
MIRHLRSHFRPAERPVQTWFPGHMDKSLKKIQAQVYERVDVVVEVHDARIPFHYRSKTLDLVAMAKPRLLVLNKRDLADRSLEPMIIERYINEANTDVLFTDSLGKDFQGKQDENLKEILEWIADTSVANPRRLPYGKRHAIGSGSDPSHVVPALGSGRKQQYHPRITRQLETIRAAALQRTKSEDSRSAPPALRGSFRYNCMVVGIPNVGKSTLINKLRNVGMGRKGSLKTAPQPGVTKSVENGIVVLQDPPVQLLDTPGIVEPLVPNRKAGLTLSMLGSIDELVCGWWEICDYLLFVLNRHGMLRYAEILDIEPTDSIHELTTGVAYRLNLQKMHTNTGRPQNRKSAEAIDATDLDVDEAAKQFVRMFRRGDFGPISLVRG